MSKVANPPLQCLIGESRAIRSVIEDIERYGASALPILVQGPTGAGKELVARAVHAVSKRDGALVAFNACAINDGMLEDALFGHVKGAFTGASRDSLGYFGEANGGSIFLDEIGGLSRQSQVKLLRAIETGVYRPVGASRDRVSSFRLISATNELLHDKVTAGDFRADLLHRLGGCVIRIPGLNARRGDIPLLVAHFLSHVALRNTITADAIGRLQEHDWTGNVRELRHVVERAVVISQGEEISERHIGKALGYEPLPPQPAASRALLYKELRDALERHDWNTEQVAGVLKVHRATVYRWINRFGLAGVAAPKIRGRPAELIEKQSALID